MALKSSVSLPGMAVVVACLLLMSGGCSASRTRSLRQVSPPASPSAEPQTPWQFVESSDDLSTLAKLIQAANLHDHLDNLTLNYTLLLPNNKAFVALEARQGISVDALINSTTLKSILLYHIFADGPLNLTNALLGKVLTMANMADVTVQAEPSMGISLAFNDLMGRAAWPTTKQAILLGSSEAYVINQVLIPVKPATIQEALSFDTSMSDMATLLMTVASLETNSTSTIFTKLLSGNMTNVTLLVPTNDAFASVCANVSSLTSAPGYLISALLAHIIPLPLDFDQLVALNGTTIPTLNPSVNFTISSAYGTIIFLGPTLDTSPLLMVPDLIAGKSFIHQINTIILPSAPDKPTFTCTNPPQDYAQSDYEQQS